MSDGARPACGSVAVLVHTPPVEDRRYVLPADLGAASTAEHAAADIFLHDHGMSVSSQARRRRPVAAAPPPTRD